MESRNQLKVKMFFKVIFWNFAVAVMHRSQYLSSCNCLLLLQVFMSKSFLILLLSLKGSCGMHKVLEYLGKL